MTAAGAHTAAWARAGTNIALVKYWGKRSSALNLPAAGSLSLTLAELGTTTGVRFLEGRPAGAAEDRVSLGGQPADAAFSGRVSRFLDLVRARASLPWAAEVSTVNNVPTAAGLASSASGFAALALAASRAAGLTLAAGELSALARQGSGSAARSMFGGFVEMEPGVRDDGTDAIAHPLPDPAWDVRLVVAITASGPKAIGSTAAMDRTAASSPFYAAWLASVPGDLAAARAAIAVRDITRLGPVIERSALRMHATAMAAEPGIIYWSPVTVAVMQAVAAARDERGLEAYFTMDAGPHVKTFCRAADAGAVAALVAAVPGVLSTVTASPGPGAELVAAPVGLGSPS